MKTFSVLCFLVCIASLGRAQQNDFQTLVSKRASFSGFGGLINEFSIVDGQGALSTGGAGAVLINQKFFLGGYGLGLATIRRKEIAGYTDLRINLGHGGFWMGYIHHPAKLLHISLHSKIGWGGISLTDTGNDQNNIDLTVDEIFVLTPHLDMELNILPWFKISLGAGYRWVSGVKNTSFHPANFNSPTATIALFFGGFSKKDK